MKTTKAIDIGDGRTSEGAALLDPIEAGIAPEGTSRFAWLVIGELVAIAGDGGNPLVRFPGQQGSGAVVARAVIDLNDAHIGRDVVLMFEGADPGRPVVMGVLKVEERSDRARSTPIEVSPDGEQLIVKATEQLVLQCGEASITLTKAGKVIIRGAYVSNRSSGVLRLKGGSVQIN
jgi:hypothetical protein